MEGEYIKGQKYVLLSHQENLSIEKRRGLETLLAANKRLNTAYVLKEQFAQLWDYRSERWARKFFEGWRRSLRWQRLGPFEKFAEMVERHWDGIAAYCRPENKVALGFVEGMNNKIRVIQRRCYGLRDEEGGAPSSLPYAVLSHSRSTRPAMRSLPSLAFLFIAALAACSPGEATSSNTEGWMPASGRWFAIQWDGKPVPFTIQIGALTSTVDSARILVGPGDRAMYIIDSHMSDGYVGHDTLTGKFELLDFLEPQETRLKLDSGPITQTWNFALNGDSLIVLRGHTDVYMQ